MRDTWDKTGDSREAKHGQPVAQKITFLYEPSYIPKLLLKSPSNRALNNYHNLSIDNSPHVYDNLSFMPEGGSAVYDEAYSRDSNGFYDYTTLGSSSVRTNVSTNASELGSEKNEMGSTTKLVRSKMEMSCQSWFTHLETVLCTISLAAGLGNLYRLPQTTLLRGGLPFVAAYVVLTVLIGLPLLFLELGIGQLAQEGFIKSWRAVPFFRGIGYVKLMAGCLLSIYYPLYMGLSVYYIIWISKSSVPFQECATVAMTQKGYRADGVNGQDCIKNTFLTFPTSSGDFKWYTIFAGILFVIWVVVTILSIRRTKSFIRSLYILFFPTLGCLIALTVKAVFTENKYESLEKMGREADWTVLKNPSVWYYAALQVFFSTNVGFGTFTTSAGIIYNKVSPLWNALGFIGANLLFGVGSILLCYIFSGEISSQTKDMPELYLVTLFYTILVKTGASQEDKSWTLVAYATILLSGFISMATITYTLLKAITVENSRRLKWWQTSIVLSFIGFVSGCAILLESEFKLVRLLDNYIVGNLILISVIIEVFALIAFYGTERIKSDFEFMLGYILSKVWLGLWWLLPILLTAIFAWALTSQPAEDFNTDPHWLSYTGWAIVLAAAIFIFIFGGYTIGKQDGYTLIDKFKASLKPSHKWGPKDPIQRHNWVQWNSKAEKGERDFTLKRKGTKDYTRSIKKNAKRVDSNFNLNASLPGKNPEYADPYHLELTSSHRIANGDNKKPLRVTSLVDSLDPPTPSITVTMRNTFHGGFTTNINPLSRTQQYEAHDSSNSEGYGTFRKGPYVIPDSNITHVCHRRLSEGEQATEL